MSYATLTSFTFVGKDPNGMYKWILTTGGGMDGHLKSTVDGVQVGDLITPIIWNTLEVLFPLSPGVHTVCQEITETSDKLCDTQSIEMEPPSCANLSIDTWKPATTNQESGKNIPFTIRSGSPNSHFLLFIDKGVLGYENIVDATTDSSGCYSGELPAQADGEYVIKLCYPVIGVCLNSYSPYTIRWGTKPIDMTTMILYAALGLGAAYIIGQVIAKDGRK